MVQERGEPHLPILLRCLAYPLQRTGRVGPARCPGRVLLGQVPFGHTPSLHPLRRRSPDIVRGLPRYFGSVRLPRFVHHRLVSLDSPIRPSATAALGKPGISWFPRKVLPCVHRVFDRAGLRRTSRYQCAGCGLPLQITASAPWSLDLSRLNTWPARSPANASALPLRVTPHDSGPVWVAAPSPCDSFIHYTLPVCAGALFSLPLRMI